MQKKIAVVAVVLLYSFMTAYSPNAVFAVASGLPHTIFVTFNGDPHTQRGFTWMTDTPEKNSRLELSKKSSFDNPVLVTSSSYSISGGDRTNIKIGNNGITQYGHKAVASTLAPGTKYYYRVGVDSTWSNMGSFTTEPKNSKEFSFIDVTDTQAAISARKDNNDYYNKWALCLFEAFHKDSNASFVMDNGDMVDNGGDLAQWQAFTDSANIELMNTTFVPVSGNHETYEADKIVGTMFVSNQYGINGICGSYKNAVVDHFNLSLPSTEKNVRQGAYYSFDYGNARFIVLNTNLLNTNGTLTAEQINWLNLECKKCNKKWKIVSMHRPLQSDGDHMAQSDIMALRKQLLKVMASDGVDIVLQGHDHIYLRSRPIDSSGKPASNTEKITENCGGVSTTFDVNPRGTVYIISGASNDMFCKNNYDLNSRNPFIASASKKIFIAKNIPSRKGVTLDSKPGGKVGSPTFADIKISGNKLYFYCYQCNIASGRLITLDSYAIMKADAKQVLQTTNKTASYKKVASINIVSFALKNRIVIAAILFVFAILICLSVLITRKRHK